uniref:Zinc finger protein 28 n=1 Tax=Cacopsylla melanoneura TaxID=428564 RepID=A0A8D8Q730_9HEMI
MFTQTPNLVLFSQQTLLCIHGNDNAYKCQQCQRLIFLSGTGTTTHKCEYCHKVFDQQSSLLSHNCPQMKPRPYKCDVCEKSFTNSQNLNTHQLIHSGIRPFKCTTCDKSFVNQSNLITHTRIHTGDRPYQCSHSDCDKSFHSKSNLNTHTYIHQGIKPHRCDICHKGFTNQSNLAMHTRIHSGHKPYVCQTCDKAFTNQSNLISHSRTHTGEKPYKCEYCEKAFINQSNLVTHRRTHTGERPYQCTYCTKTFINQSNLVCHTRTHTGEKPYICEYCEKGFINQSNLNIHIRTHTGFRPYVCEVCEKTFTNQSNLITHGRTHSGERPYKCNSCDKKFITQSNLAQHSCMNSNFAKPYQCDRCSQFFVDRMHLISHTCVEDVKPNVDNLQSQMNTADEQAKLKMQHEQQQQLQQQQQKHQSQASQQGVQKILSQAVSASSQSSIASSTESSDSSTQNSQNTETSQSQTLSPGHVITSSPGQFTQFGVAATARQGTKKINLTPTQQKQLQQLLFTKPQLVKAGNQQSINQLKQVLFLKTGVISKLNKSGKAEEQTILCQNPLSADANLSQMIIVKQQDPNSNQLIGEPITNEQVAQLQMAMKHHQKTMARLKKKDTTPSSSATQTKTTTSVMSSLPPGTLGPPPPYTMTETKLISSVIEASTQISGQHTDQQQPTAHLQLHVANNASKEDQQKISSAGVTILTQSKPVMAQGFKPQHGQIIARVLTGATGSRTVISSGDTKSIPVSFTTTPTRVSSPASTKPDSIPVTSQASSPEKQNFPVNIKHQVVGKFVTGGQNQQILVQNQAGLLKNGKNQPLVAKFVTQGSHNAHMIKVLSHPQGAQPFIGKISTGGANSKPIVAKITNAQGQPIYSMEDLFSQSNKAGTTCFRIASSPTCNSKPQKIVASLTPPTQSVMQDQLLKHPNILIKPQQCALSPQLSQGSPRSQLESQKPIQQQLTNQQITAITSQAQAQLQQLSPNNASHSSFGKEDANVSKSQQQNLFTTQYVQTISNQTTGCASQQKIQVALSQADNTQLHQYLQNNQILTQVPNKIITSSSAATPQLVRMVPAGSLKNLGGNPFILTGAGKTQQSTVLDPQQITSQSSILLSPQALQTTNGRTLTLVQQGNGQPLLLPSNFQGGTLNIKTLQGMKVIPFSQNGRQQVLARIVPPPVKTSQVAPTVTTQKPNIVENGDLAPT